MTVNEREYMRTQEPGSSIGSGLSETSGFLKLTLGFIGLVVVGIVLASTLGLFQPEEIVIVDSRPRHDSEFELPTITPVPSREKTLEQMSPVDINTADYKDLRRLPRVRAFIANGIILGRPYFCVEQLDDVYGIGPKTVELLRRHVVIRRDSLERHFPCEYHQHRLIEREDQAAAEDNEVKATQVLRSGMPIGTESRTE